ncbi:MAG: hypothetical protein ACM3H8_07725 [Sphingobacteriales bacterium]
MAVDKVIDDLAHLLCRCKEKIPERRGDEEREEKILSGEMPMKYFPKQV